MELLYLFSCVFFEEICFVQSVNLRKKCSAGKGQKAGRNLNVLQCVDSKNSPSGGALCIYVEEAMIWPVFQIPRGTYSKETV